MGTERDRPVTGTPLQRRLKNKEPREIQTKTKLDSEGRKRRKKKEGKEGEKTRSRQFAERRLKLPNCFSLDLGSKPEVV